MDQEKSDSSCRASKINLSHFSVTNPAIVLVFIIAAMVLGIVGYRAIPQRKDPDFPIRQACVQVPWPGNSAEQIELQVTKKIENVCGRNKNVKNVESTVQPGLSTTFIELEDCVNDTAKEFDDIGIKLANAAPDLPRGAGPVMFIKDFGDTTALMLTVASPPFSDTEIDARVAGITAKVREIRSTRGVKESGTPATIIYGYPGQMDRRLVEAAASRFQIFAKLHGFARDLRVIEGEGFLGIDFLATANEGELERYLADYLEQYIKPGEISPDAWGPLMVYDLEDLGNRLTAAAPDKYTYRQLDDYTRIIADGLRGIPSATAVDRRGVLSEAIYLSYSQERLAQSGLNPARLPDIMAARNIPGATGLTGTAQAGSQTIFFQTAGQFNSEREIGDVVISEANGSPVYLRDLVSISRKYRLPASYLNFLTWQDESGVWHRSRAITISVQMKPGRHIEELGKEITSRLDELKKQVPADLVAVRTSDQPRQVREQIELLNSALLEAIILVVLISLIGFWDWRSAVIMALSIPVTLAMTYGGMWVLGLDMQQVSIASLIIALGLLVDNPVVAGDSIKVAMAEGHAPLTASWLGPTRLFKAIIFATLTNIIAYIPLALIPGNVGKFLFSLPVVVALSLVASVIVSQCMVPIIGRYLLKPQAEASTRELREKVATKLYYRFASFCVRHRWQVVGAATVLLLAGLIFAARLPTQMFPDDLQYLCTVDLNASSDSTFSATNEKARETEKAVIEIAQDLEKEMHGHEETQKKGRPARVLKSVCTFVGGGGPRFWFSIEPELSKISYAQLIIECRDKRYTNRLIPLLVEKIPQKVAGVRFDVKKLQTGTSFKTPVEFYVTGPDSDWKSLLGYSAQIRDIFRSIPTAMSIRDDWQEPISTVDLKPVEDKATMVGITNADVARSVALALDGVPVGTMLEGQYSIPIIVRLRAEERAELDDIMNLYVYSSMNGTSVQLRQIVSGEMTLQPFFLHRRNFNRCIKPGCLPVPGAWASTVYAKAQPEVKKLRLLPGYGIAPSGEKEKQLENFPHLGRAMMMSVIGIFLVLVVQFKSAVKPLIVFAAVPFGLIGALLGLIITGLPFGFMAFMGIASLVGIIVSHIIVLFDYIEARHAEGESVVDAVIDAGLARLRPVLITVAATVIALFPLAIHGGPLWQPLCFAQIGGLSLATLVTLILVPTIYCIFVLDLKIVKWGAADPTVESVKRPPA